MGKAGEMEGKLRDRKSRRNGGKVKGWEKQGKWWERKGNIMIHVEKCMKENIMKWEGMGKESKMEWKGKDRQIHNLVFWHQKS